MTNQTVQFIPDSDSASISSDVAIFNGLIHTTQIPLRVDGTREMGSIAEQSRCTLQALKAALEKVGSGLSQVLHLTIYLTDMAERAAFNEVYKEFFSPPWPVRAAIGVAALGTEGMKVEVTAVAALVR